MEIEIETFCGFCSKACKEGFYEGNGIFYQCVTPYGELLYRCTASLQVVTAGTCCHCGKFHMAERRHPLSLRIAHAQFFIRIKE